ncbi:MAG: hypothetical protein K5697_00030 [Lachnospiraceae bacterium]|nr:hypothetical protein [Lachnospiraceae bacterium]
MVFEITGYEDETRDTRSNLVWISANDSRAGADLFEEYGTLINSMEAQKSTVNMPKADAEDIIKLLWDNGFVLSEKEGKNIVVRVRDLIDLKFSRNSKNNIKTQFRPKSLNTLNPREFRRGLMNCIFNTSRELLEDISDLPLEWYEGELSCYVEADGRINGMLLLHRLTSGSIRVEFMSAFGPDARTDLLHLMQFSSRRALELYPEDTMLIIPRRDDSAEKLTGYLFPKAVGGTCIYGERDEILKKKGETSASLSN